jgi:probable HAF family extracellular repeat protein
MRGFDRSWLGIAAFVLSSAHAASTYTATALGTLGATWSRGEAINALGQVVGQAATTDGSSRAFLYAHGAMADLGTLGGSTSYAFGINAHGEVAGHAEAAAGATHAFLWSAGRMQDLGTLGGTHSYAFDVNASGAVVGHSWTTDGGAAFVRSAGAMAPLPTPAGASGQAFAVNDRGQVAGYVVAADGSSRAVIWSAGTTTDLGTLGGIDSWGHAINAAGHVAGTSLAADGLRHAFLHDGDAMHDLGTLGGVESYGMGINVLDHVVGVFRTRDGESRAFVYADGAAHDLNGRVVAGLPEGTTLFEANDINDAGQIVANGCANGRCQAFRLDPIAGPVAVEYRHAAHGHYFVTASDDEIAALDRRAFAGWSRTGEAFAVLPLDAPGADNVCRFWSGETYGAVSLHFYTPVAGECAIVRGNAAWRFEGEVFALARPDATGNCAAGTLPLYRLYTSLGGVPYHRYTTRLAIRAEMMRQGFVPEGSGIGVIGCVPAA